MPPRFQAAPQLAVNDPSVTKERLRPEAAPTGGRQVDPTAGTDLARLSQSLLGLASPLTQLANTMHEKEVKKAALQGQELASAAMEDIRKTGKAIKAGELATTDSPWVRYFAREQFGGMMASKMSSDFAAHMLANPLEDTDPAAFDKAYAEFRSKWLEQVGPQDPAFKTGFLKPAESAAEGMRNAWIQQASGRLMKQLDEGNYNVARHAATDWIAEGTSVDLAIQKIVENNNASMMTRPNDGAKIVRATVKGILDAADRNPRHAEEILAMLDKIPAGSGMMGDISWVVEEVTKHRDEALTRRSKMDSEEARIAKQLERDSTDDFYDSIQDALDKAVEGGADPSSVDLSPLLQQARDAGLNMTAITPHVRDLVNDYKSAREFDDVPTAEYLKDKALAGTLRPGDLLQARTHLTEKTYKELRTFMKDAQSAAGSRKGSSAYLRQILTRPELTRALSNIYGWYTSTFGFDKANRQAGINAKQRMEWDFTQWAGTKEGRVALSSDDPTALEKWVLKKSFELTGRNFEEWLKNPTEKSSVVVLDWKKDLVTSASNVNALEQEYEAYLRKPHDPEAYPFLMLFLNEYNIPLDQAKVFVETQRRLANDAK